MKPVTASGRIREPLAVTNRRLLTSYFSRTSAGRSTIRSIITGTTDRPRARCSSTIASVASGSNRRRVTTVLPITAAITSCPKPHAWNIGAATTVVSP